MKAIKNLTTCAFAAVFMTGAATAQQLSFSDAKLVSGNELEAGSAYRFSDVTSGLDAVVTISNLSNASLLSIDNASSDSIVNAGWNPSFVGTGEAGDLHYADFSILFYANGTNELKAPSQFTTTIFGNDFINEPAGFSMEFVQVEGFSWVIQASDIFNSTNSELLKSDSKLSQLALWNFDNKAGYTMRYGWQGDNSERSFNAMMLNIPNFSETLDDRFNFSLTQNLTLDSSPTAVPEPSSVFLIVISIFPLVLRRNRH